MELEIIKDTKKAVKKQDKLFYEGDVVKFKAYASDYIKGRIAYIDYANKIIRFDISKDFKSCLLKVDLEYLIDIKKICSQNKEVIKLNEAIEHLEELIKTNNWICEECKKEHIQLKLWLEELRECRKSMSRGI